MWFPPNESPMAHDLKYEDGSVDIIQNVWHIGFLPPSLH